MKESLNTSKTIYFNDFVMVRVDKTLKEMMEEKPYSRFDVFHWHPMFDFLNPIFKKWKAKSLIEIEGEDVIIAGDHVRPSRNESKGYDLRTRIEYYETKGFLETGYDYSEIKECSENAYERLKRTAVKQYDILLSNAGVAGVGKARSCLITHNPAKRSCTGDVFTIRLKNINPFYFYCFLKSKIGRVQILQIKSGVGTENINAEETLSMVIPFIPDPVQSHIETEYKKMAVYHNKAMAAKAKGNEAGYRKNIEIAESMLRELISKTETVIRGERKDIF